MATARQLTSGHRFSLSIDGHPIAQFTELQGISTTVEPVSYRTLAPVTLTLRRDKTNDLRLFTWHRSGMRKNGTLSIYGAAAAAVARYRLTNAVATDCRTVFKVDSATPKRNTVQVEEITMVVERIERW